MLQPVVIVTTHNPPLIFVALYQVLGDNGDTGATEVMRKEELW